MYRIPLPRKISSFLFGDRHRYGKYPPSADPDWTKWEEISSQHYEQGKKSRVVSAVEEIGYRHVSDKSLAGKTVLELGSGDIPHRRYWNDTPAKYVAVDIRREMLRRTRGVLQQVDTRDLCVSIEAKSRTLPFNDTTFDCVFSFYSLEHIPNLLEYLREVSRVMKPGGALIGCIPAEGGLAWGCGRAATTKRWVKRAYGLELTKLICWEHPNFADQVIAMLDRVFEKEYLSWWPLGIPVVDLNLVVSFRYVKRGSAGSV